MPESPNERVVVPTRGWDIQLIIKDKDYSADLYRVRIISSITLPYQTILFDIFIDQNDIILDKMYGQDKIKMQIRLLEQDQIPSDQIDFELMYITSDYPLTMKKPESEGHQKERVPMSFVAVPRDAFKSATTYLNRIFLQKTLKQCIETIVNEDVGASINYDTDGENTTVIDQIIIPPRTLMKTIRYLDETFGLFKGPTVQFIDKDNKLHILNLNKKFTKDQTFTVYQLALDSVDDEIIDKCTDGKNFYTYANLESTYSGNTKFSTLAKSQVHVVKPRDTLSYSIIHDMNTIISDYGLVYKNPKSYTDDLIDSRTRVYTKHTGYDYDDTFAISEITPSISNMSGLSIELEKNLPFFNLMKVGEIVKFNSSNLEITDLTGKYILRSSDIRFEKEGDWQATAKLNLIRTNKTI